MNYDRLFSEDVFCFLPSPVREIFKNVKFDEIYSFAGGHPNAETFPIETIKRISTEVLDKFGGKALQYGGTQGVPELIKALSKRYGVHEDNIQITTSSQQGIDVCTRIMVNPGDVILTLNPAYLGALQSFKSYRANLVAIDGFTKETCGVPADVLAKAKFCYVIPDFQNPSGETMSLGQRKALVEMSKEFGFVIVEDSPYREIRYSGEDVPTIYSLAPERTLFLGSFSKIFAPGFRLGWIFGPKEILHQIYICKQALDLCPPILDQYIAAEYVNSGELDATLPKTKEYYRRKRDCLLQLLEKYMPEGTTWTHPEGGLFLFVTLPQGCDTIAMYKDALNSSVAYVAGSFFYIDGSHRNTMRMSFAFIDYQKMEKGVQILADVIRRNTPEIYKYSGAGNDFVVLYEDKKDRWEGYRETDAISALCDRKTGYEAADGRVGADGLMILSHSDDHDFKMDYYNSDGSGGMMCGNGGRCIVAFAEQMGIKPGNGKYYEFEAADGLHTGEILSMEGNTKTIRLRMIDAFGLKKVLGGYFLNTGTRHFVKFVPDVEAVDVENEGKIYRHHEIFAPEGTNVNFVTELEDGDLKIRTFEKGVEAETLACGTGITAAAIAAYYNSGKAEKEKTYTIHTRNNILKVEFVPENCAESGIVAIDVYLTGPAELI